MRPDDHEIISNASIVSSQGFRRGFNLFTAGSRFPPFFGVVRFDEREKTNKHTRVWVIYAVVNKAREKEREKKKRAKGKYFLHFFRRAESPDWLIAAAGKEKPVEQEIEIYCRLQKKGREGDIICDKELFFLPKKSGRQWLRKRKVIALLLGRDRSFRLLPHFFKVKRTQRNVCSNEWANLKRVEKHLPSRKHIIGLPLPLLYKCSIKRTKEQKTIW